MVLGGSGRDRTGRAFPGASRGAVFATGVRAGLPIGLGYFAVALAIGLYWAQAKFPPLSSALFSAFNLSSTGEFAGINIMGERGHLAELAATTVLVNLRYLLMATSLAQRLPQSVGTGTRMLMAWGVTDEIYAINISRRRLQPPFYLGSMVLPILGWTLGTLLGAYAGEVIPPSFQSAAGILLFAMFVAILIPPLKESGRVRIVALLAGVASVALAMGVPQLADGWRIIIATLFAAGFGASFLPYVPPVKLSQPKAGPPTAEETS